NHNHFAPTGATVAARGRAQDRRLLSAGPPRNLFVRSTRMLHTRANPSPPVARPSRKEAFFGFPARRENFFRDLLSRKTARLIYCSVLRSRAAQHSNHDKPHSVFYKACAGTAMAIHSRAPST